MDKLIKPKVLEEFLQKIGFSQYEKEVYLTLVNLKEASVLEISKNCLVPLPKIYETLNKLANKGLVFLASGRPKKYTIVHPRSFFNRAIELEERRLMNLEKEKTRILKSFKQVEKELSDEIQIIRGKAKVFDWLMKILKSSFKSYDAIIRLRTYPNPLMPLFKNKIKKGFKARIVGPKGREKIAYKYFKNGFQVKLSDQLKVFILFSIWDKKILTVNLSDKPEDYTTIISRSPELVKKFYELFLYHWQQGQKL